MDKNDNFIYFNEHGRIKKYYISDLFQGSNLADVIYIFADFETSDKECTIMFRRADGMLIGEVEALKEASGHINPATGQEMSCYSYVIGDDVLGAAGQLQMTVRYYDQYIDPITGIEENPIKATGLVTTKVYESVPTFGGQSTIIANLNRKINIISEQLNIHISDYSSHNHDDIYYKKSLSDTLFGRSIHFQGGDLILKNNLNQELSREKVPTIYEYAPPGDLLFSGTGTFVIKTPINPKTNFLIMPLSEADVSFAIYMAVITPEIDPTTAEYYRVSNSTLETLERNATIRIKDLSYRPYQADTNYYADVNYEVNGINKLEEGHSVILEDPWELVETYGELRWGVASSGYFLVYELE